MKLTQYSVSSLVSRIEDRFNDSRKDIIETLVELLQAKKKFKFEKDKPTASNNIDDFEIDSIERDEEGKIIVCGTTARDKEETQTNIDNLTTDTLIAIAYQIANQLE